MAMRNLTFIRTGQDVVDSVAEASRERGIDEEVLAQCISVTRRHFSDLMSRDLSTREESRIHAYFGGVLRKQIMRSRGPMMKDHRMRLILATLAEDLSRNGFSADRIAHELESEFGPCALAWVEEHLDGAKQLQAS